MPDPTPTVEELQAQLHAAQAEISRLSASEKFYREIVDNQSDLICYFTPDLTLLYANQSYCHRLGKKPEELLGKCFLDWVPATEHNRIRKHIGAITPASPYATSITRLINYDGVKLWVDWVDAAVFDADGQIIGFLGVGRDVTLEHELLYELQRHSAILHQSLDLITMTDLNGKILYLNPSGAKLIGYESPFEVIGNNYLDYYTEEDREFVQQTIVPGLKSGQWRGETRLRAVDGTLIDVEQTAFVLMEDDNTIGYASIMRDIRTQKQTQVAIKQSEERFSKIFSMMPVPAGIIGLEDRCVQDVNQAFLHVSGYQHDEIVGHLAWKLGLLLENKYLEELVSEFSDDGILSSQELNLRTKSGEIRTMLVSGTTLELYDQPCILLAAQDMTVQKRAQSREQVMVGYLNGMLEAIDELIQIPDEDLFERRSVELIRERLGVERAAVFIVDDQTLRFSGTYGTDRSGNTVDEHAMTGSLYPVFNQLADSIAQPWVLTEQGRLVDWNGYTEQAFGTSWIATTPLRIGDQLIGVISNDAGITQAPFDYTRQEAIALYASALGNIIQRRRAEKALRASEERYRLLLESISVMVIQVDREGNILYVNQQASGYFGQPPDRLIGGHLRDCYAADALACMLDSVQAVIASGDSIQYERPALRNPDIIFSTKIYPIRDDTGEITSVIYNSFDITDIRHTQHALRESQDRYRTIVETTREGIWLADATGIAVYANQSLADMTGYSVDEIVGSSVFKFTDPERRPVLQAKFMERRNGIAERYDFQFRRKDGESLWTSVSVTPLLDEQKTVTGFLTIVTDITARKAQEIALARSEARQRALFNALPDLIFHTDRNGVFLDYHAPDPGQLLLSPEAFVGHPVIEVLPPHLASLQLHATRQALETGNVVQIEYSIDVQASTHHYEARIAPVSSEEVLVIVRDITARKDAEAALQSANDLLEQRVRERTAELEQERKLLRTLIDSMPDLIFAKDLDHRFILANQALADFAGVTHPAVLIGKTDFDLFPAEKAQIYQYTDAQVLQTGLPFLNHEENVSGTHSSLSWVLNNKVPLRTQDGDIIGLVGISHDISNLKHTEAILEQKYHDERMLHHYLRMLHDITVELNAIDELDAFYRRVVELGLSKLEFDRVGFFLYNPEKQEAIGTYGTDREGNIRSENEIRFVLKEQGLMWRTLHNPQHFYLEKTDDDLKDKDQHIGNGWHAAVALWQGNHNLGWIVTDNIIHGQPSSPIRLEILAQYGVLVASMLARKQAEQSLRRSETLYRSVISTMTEGILVQSKDGQVQAWNAALEQMLGLSGEQITSQQPHDPNWYAITEDGILITPEMYGTALTLNTGQPIWDQVACIHKPDGTRNWVSVNSLPIYLDHTEHPAMVLATLTDITRHKLAEDALLESQAKYRQLVETMGGGIIMLDLQGVLTYANDRFCEMVNVRRDEFVGKNFLNTLPNALHPPVANRLAERQQGISSSYELEFSRLDGTNVYALVIGSPLYDRNGVISGSYAVLIDITAQKEAEKALRRALEREKELGQLKSQFVSTTSHEFRTPLATILTTTEMLLHYRDKLDPEQINARLEKIRRQVGHLRQILEDVLQLARIQARRVSYAPVQGNLHALCEEIAEEFNLAETGQHRVRYHAPDHVLEMVFDPRLMRQIISNLVSNGLKYSPQDRQVDLILKRDGESIVINVRDYGIGIPLDSLQHLFEPFFRAANVGTIPGTGLGLAIVKESIEMHGGTISLETVQNQGSLFTVQFPFSTEVPPVLAPDSEDDQ